MFKKLFITALGGFILLIAALFVIIPGPAILLAPIGLAILSLEYDWARKYLRQCQSLLSKGSKRMDEWLAKHKMRKFRH